jgi:hypothetical protein
MVRFYRKAAQGFPETKIDDGAHETPLVLAMQSGSANARRGGILVGHVQAGQE